MPDNPNRFRSGVVRGKIAVAAPAKSNGSRPIPLEIKTGGMSSLSDRFCISFCTTCHNRAYQLKQVFEKNLSTILQDSHDVEWVVLDYNSQDDLHPFITERLKDIGGGLTYVRERSGRPWHVCIAKNIAHNLANGDILMNLDCDNSIGDALTIIRDEFRGSIGCLHLWSGRYGDGTFGRIATRRHMFRAAGGYDEDFYPMAFQDVDFLQRLKDLGVVVKHRPCQPSLAIPNSEDDSTANCSVNGMKWEDFQRANRAKSLANRRAKRFIANEGRPWGVGQLELICQAMV
jgi:hypothetical protein